MGDRPEYFKFHVDPHYNVIILNNPKIKALYKRSRILSQDLIHYTKVYKVNTKIRF